MKKTLRAHAFAPALSVLTLALASAVQAQTVELDPVVVSATRIEQKLSDVIPSATVITREEIERSQAPTLVDLIQGQPGVEIGRNGGPGTVASIFMRGQDSKNVAVFIDGIPVQRDAIGGLKLVDIPPSQIEKIEILRGNMSAVYGESAVGGVIQIFTRAGKGKSGPTASVTYGSRNTSDLTAGYNLNLKDYKLGFSVQRHKSDGFSAMNPRQDARVNPENDSFERESIFLNAEKSLYKENVIGFQANKINAAVEYDRNQAFSGDDSDDSNNSKQKSSDLTVYGRFSLAVDWTSRLAITHSNFENLEFKNAIPEQYGNYKGNQLGIQWGNAYKIGSDNATFGMDIADAEFKTNGEIYHRDQIGYFMGYSGRVEELDYQVNLRRDEIKDKTISLDQSANTFLLGLGYFISDYTKLTALISSSFRAPSAEEYSQSSNLKSEDHKGYEVGVAHDINFGILKAIYFNNKSTNSIVYNNGSFEFENIGVKNKGFEFSLDGNSSGWGYSLSSIFQDPRNVETNTRLARRAKKYTSILLTKTAMGFDFGTKILWLGNRKDIDNPSDKKFNSSYTLVNLTASKKLSPEWTGRVKLENAFDEDYQLAYGYNTPPRGVFVTLQYSPK